MCTISGAIATTNTKARIKILVRSLGIEEMKKRIEKEWHAIREGALKVAPARIAELKAFFAPHTYENNATDETCEAQLSANRDFSIWYKQNTRDHKSAGLSYC